MSDKTLEAISEDPPNNGPDGMNNPQIAKKLQKYWGAHETAQPSAAESLDRLRIRNDNIRVTKGLRTRGESMLRPEMLEEIERLRAEGHTIGLDGGGKEWNCRFDNKVFTGTTPMEAFEAAVTALPKPKAKKKKKK